MPGLTGNDARAVGRVVSGATPMAATAPAAKLRSRVVPTAAGGRVSARTVCVSPFPEDTNRVLYFGGFAAQAAPTRPGYTGITDIDTVKNECAPQNQRSLYSPRSWSQRPLVGAQPTTQPADPRPSRAGLAWDKNGDGKLTADEVSREQLFKNLDDGGGVVTMEEASSFSPACRPEATLRGGRLRELPAPGRLQATRPRGGGQGWDSRQMC